MSKQLTSAKACEERVSEKTRNSAFAMAKTEAHQKAVRAIDSLIATITEEATLNGRTAEWEWIKQNMPYTDQGALFEARAKKRLTELQAQPEQPKSKG